MGFRHCALLQFWERRVNAPGGHDFSDIGIQALTVDERSGSALPGDAESGCQCGDLHSIRQRIAFEQIDSQSRDKGVSPTGRVHGLEVYGWIMDCKVGGLQVTAVMPKGNDDGRNPFLKEIFCLLFYGIDFRTQSGGFFFVGNQDIDGTVQLLWHVG